MARVRSWIHSEAIIRVRNIHEGGGHLAGGEQGRGRALRTAEDEGTLES